MMRFTTLAPDNSITFITPPTNVKKYQTGVYYMSIIVYNNFPTFIRKEITQPTKFISL